MMVFIADLMAASGRRFDPVDAAVIEEISGFDLALAESLILDWDGALGSLERLARASMPAVKMRASADYTGEPTTAERPPFDRVLAWGRRELDLVPPEGIVCHVAADLLADPSAVTKRVWVAQVAVVFPLVEQHRYRLASWVAGERRKLALPWREATDLLELEIGPLASAVIDSPQLRASRTRVDLLRWLRQARNDLAHRRTLERTFVQRGRRLIARDLREQQ
jgi:hypothetical protein